MALRQQRLALGGVAGLRLERHFGGDRKDRRAGAELLARGLVEMFAHRLDFLRAAEIGLLQDEQHVLFPAVVDQVEEIPRRCAHGLVIEKTKRTRSAIGTNSSAMLLVLRDDGIGARAYRRY
jgi:hypothetical protein